LLYPQGPLNCLAFRYFDLERTWWWLFWRRVVCTNCVSTFLVLYGSILSFLWSILVLYGSILSFLWSILVLYGSILSFLWSILWIIVCLLCYYWFSAYTNGLVLNHFKLTLGDFCEKTRLFCIFNLIALCIAINVHALDVPMT
jgi:hypothetical protein